MPVWVHAIVKSLFEGHTLCWARLYTQRVKSSFCRERMETSALEKSSKLPTSAQLACLCVMHSERGDFRHCRTTHQGQPEKAHWCLYCRAELTELSSQKPKWKTSSSSLIFKEYPLNQHQHFPCLQYLRRSMVVTCLCTVCTESPGGGYVNCFRTRWQCCHPVFSLSLSPLCCSRWMETYS